MTEIDKDKELQRELQRIHWRKYLNYGIVEVKVRNGECKLIEIKRSYTDEDVAS